MANVNVPQNRRRAKLLRRRREIDRMIVKMRAEATAQGVSPEDLERKIRQLRRDMRYAR